MIRVSMVEDDPGTRQGYVRLLRHSQEIICVGVAASVDEALAEIPGMRPDVVLMDINLGEGSGIDCVARLKRKLPKVQVLMLTTYDDSETDLQFTAGWGERIYFEASHGPGTARRHPGCV